MADRIGIAPSILSADFAGLGEAIAQTLVQPVAGDRAAALAVYRLDHVIAQYAAAAGLSSSSNRA